VRERGQDKVPVNGLAGRVFRQHAEGGKGGGGDIFGGWGLGVLDVLHVPYS